jgi:CubicO group peptidase (beta-lactamase class C family)
MSPGALSESGLRGLHDAMAKHVTCGEIPGVVALVSRHGDVHVDAIGSMAIAGQPMRRDTIFRISSMTKPVTAVATLLLVDEGRLALDEPVDRLLPELADRRVLRGVDAELTDTVAAQRPITVRDLLTSRMGFGHVLRPPDATPIQRAERELGLASLAAPKPAPMHAPDEWLRRLGTLPLMAQPGDAWLYATAYHVLGILIARAAGQFLDDFLRERLFEPLGMRDTALTFDAAQQSRVATSYIWDTASSRLRVYDDPTDSQWSRPPVFPDAGAGLLSTADDYFAFAQMLLDDGRHQGRQILSSAAVRAMTTDHLSAAQREGGIAILGQGSGYGYGVSVRDVGGDGTGRRYGWDGGLGSCWTNDSGKGVVGILLTQRMWASPTPPEIATDFWTSVCSSLE